MRNKIFLKNKKGFTLVELMVVISITGFLATLAFTNLNLSRAKGRDTKREADLTQLEKAIQMYYIDNGAYPSTGSSTATCFNTCSGSWNNGLDTLLKPYISPVPVDPLNKAGGDCTTNFYYAFCNMTSSSTHPALGDCGTSTDAIVLYAYSNNAGTPEDPNSPIRNDCHTGGKGMSTRRFYK